MHLPSCVYTLVLWLLATQAVAQQRIRQTVESGYPLYTVSNPALVCSDVIYIDREGFQQKGTRDCSGKSEKEKIKPHLIRAGAKVGSVVGTLGSGGSYPTCKADGELYCATTAAFPAIPTEGLAAKIVQGQTLAGISGTAPGESHLTCSGGGQSGCVATATYRTMDLSALSTANANLLASNFEVLLRSALPFQFWDSSGQRHMQVGDVNLNAASVRQGVELFGVSGTLPPRPSDCASDGANGCVATPSYKAMQTSGAQNSIIAGQSAGGLSGNVVLPPVSKVLSGVSFGAALSQSGSLTLPAAHQVLAGSGSYGASDTPLTPSYSPDFPALANVLSSDTVNGSTGTLGACSGGQQLGCLTTSNYPSMNLTYAGGVSGLTSATFNSTIRSGGTFEFWDADGNRHAVAGDTDLTAANVQSGVNIFGVAGALTVVAPSCTSDGQSNCMVDGTNYKAGALAGAAAKLRVGQTLAGVAGNVVLPAVGKVLSGVSYGVGGNALTGTLQLPAAADVKAGSGNYGDPGAPLTPSYNPDFPSLANVRSSDTVNGIAGTLADCATGNQSGCVTTATYKSIDLSAIGSGVLDLTASNFNSSLASAGQFEFWDSNGTRHLASGDTDLVAANIVNGVNIFGVNGIATAAPGNCAANGAQNCVATGSYFAGPSCSLLGSACYLPSYQAGTQPLKAINFDAIDAGKASFAANLTLGGVQGTLSLCAAGGGVGCLTSSSFRSMNVSTAGTATGLTAANFNSRLAAAGESEFWDAMGYRHSISGDPDLAADNIKAATVLHGVSGQYPSASYPLASNTGTTDLTLFSTQLTSAGNFEFFDSAGNAYSSSGDADLLASQVRNSVAFENLSITGSFVQQFNCPSGYVKVPGDSAYGTNDFCVMKYEAKQNAGGTLLAQATGTFYITSGVSSVAIAPLCRALGVGYELIHNDHWMSIAANAAGLASNWTGGSVGSGALVKGHTDNSPSAYCPASSDDNLFYVETTCTNVSTGDTADQRRTHTLSNGSVIWDLAGNFFEIVNSINFNDKPHPGGGLHEYSAVVGTITTSLKDLIPTNAVKSYWVNSWNSTQGVGMFYGGANGSYGWMMRGGGIGYSLTTSGLFMASFSQTYNDTTRCVMQAPNP